MQYQKRSLEFSRDEMRKCFGF